MYKLEEGPTEVEVTLTRNWLWDTITFDWQGFKLIEGKDSVSLPLSVTVPLKPKITTRNILGSEDYDLQFMIKEESNGHNLTKWTAPKKGFVKTRCDSIEEGTSEKRRRNMTFILE